MVVSSTILSIPIFSNICTFNYELSRYHELLSIVSMWYVMRHYHVCWILDKNQEKIMEKADHHCNPGTVNEGQGCREHAVLLAGQIRCWCELL